MKPPKVSLALVRKAMQIAFDGKAPNWLPPRRPTGLGVNALPEVWLEVRPDGSWWVMRRKQEGADDVCLAVMPADVVTAIQASRVPLVLEAI